MVPEQPALDFQALFESAPGLFLVLREVVKGRGSMLRRLQGMRPGLKVLCMSGYTGGAAEALGLMEAGFAFMQKPVMPDALLSSWTR